MSVLKKAQLPVGCAQWIQDENFQISQFGSQEAEDFAFSARNEVEWLNEHMAEIFSKNQLDVTEIFKTPGKLRGKTPRTARKRNPLETRQPLTDIFSKNTPCKSSPLHVNRPPKEVPKFQVAKDSTRVIHEKTDKPNTDSGYHGMSEDDMDVDEVAAITQVVVSLPSTQEVEEGSTSPKLPLNTNEATQNSERQRTTEGSFHSALEEINKKEFSKELPDLPGEEDMAVDSNNPAESTKTPHQSDPSTLLDPNPSDPPALVEVVAVSEDAMDLGGMENESLLEENPSIDASHSSSAESSPAKPLVRKSSLTFAALPAREPLTTKKSIGAQVSGTSHFEQSRATMNRGSFLGRFTGGKSIGSLRQPDIVHATSDDEMDIDKTEKHALAREESDGETKITKLHNKSSTQRLHEKINMLGKSQPARLTKSIPAAAILTQPNYPDLAAFDSVVATTSQISTETKVVSIPSNDDDDDWIQPPQTDPGELKRPQLPKSISVDVMEDIRGKRNISDQQFGIGNYDRDPVKESSPLRQNVIPDPQCSERIYSQPALAYTPKSPLKTAAQSLLETAAAPTSTLEPETSHGGFTKTSTTPTSTPSPKRYVDGPLSASKSKLQSIMKTARGLFTSSAGISAQAKMETMSPHSTRKRGRDQAPIENENPSAKPARTLEDRMLADSHCKKQTKAAAFEQCTSTLARSDEGRKTRSSTEKEVKRKEGEARERERIESELEQSRETEERNVVAQNRDLRSTNLTDVSQHAEVEETKITNHMKQNKPIRQSPRRAQNQQKPMKADGHMENQPNEADNSQKTHLMAPPLNPHQQPSHIQRPKEPRRPVKPAKEAAPKPKPQPVAIRVGTLSQRIPLTNAAISSTLQDSLPPAPPPKQSGPVKKPSTASLQSSVSNNSLKSSVTTNAPKPKALLAAERKKEQDEKEAQRKLEQKREIERKRAAQQDEIRRQEQAQRQEIERQRERERAATVEDPRKIAQRQAIEKRRLEVLKKEQQRQGAQHEKSQPLPNSTRHELGATRPPSRLHAAQDYNRPANQPPINPARPVKRIFDPETDDEPFRSVRTQGAPPYQQSDAKRRRTEDEEVQEIIIRPTMAPPIRQSNIRKDGPKQSIYANGYTSTQAPSNSYHHSSMVKQSTHNQTYQQHQQHPTQMSRAGVPSEMAKYTHGKIPFAEVPNPPPKSPHRARQAATAPTKSSPQCINGDNIELDEILTDDEDSESEDDKAAKGAMIADWAKSPYLGDQLETQERYADPDEIFGPVGSPHMEEMFKGREHRYRNRTSSANWAGSDRLTEDEIRSDRAAREKLRRQGGWSFEL